MNILSHKFRAKVSILLLIALVSGVAACSSVWLIKTKVLKQETQFTALILALAEGDDRSRLEAALEIGPESWERALETYMEKWDPTPGTEINEYRALIESRFHIALNTIDEVEDDRLLVFALYGPPSEVIAHGGFIRWAYSPPGEIQLAANPIRLLRTGMEFTVSFTKKGGEPFQILLDGLSGQPPPGPLSENDHAMLESIMARQDSGEWLKSAALLRARASPSGRSFRLLFQGAASEDEIVRQTAYEVLRPLTPGLPVIYVEGDVPESRFGGIRVMRKPTDIEEPEPTRIAFDTHQIFPYEPREHLSSDEIASLTPAGSTETEQPTVLDPLFPTGRGRSNYLDTFFTAGEFLEDDDYQSALVEVARAQEAGTITKAEGHFLSAVIYFGEDEPGARRLADSNIRRAIALDSTNKRYHLLLASILNRSTFLVYADNTLDRLLSEDLRVPDALTLKGVIRLQGLWQLGWQAGGWGEMSRQGIVRSMPRTAFTAEALKFLHEALLLDPHNEMAIWWLALHHILAGEWSEILRISEFMVQQGILHGEALLARGMALQHLQQLEEAESAYRAGLAILGSDYVDAAESPLWISPPSGGGVTLGVTIDSLSPSSAAPTSGSELRVNPEHFWRARDPLFSTPENERLMEQYRRFAYVTWVYSDVLTGVRGWETARGAVYMRYGKPGSIKQSSAFKGEPGEAWTYDSVIDSFIVTFGGAYMTGNLRIWPILPEELENVVESRSDYLEKTEEIPGLDTIIGVPDTHALIARWFVFLDTPEHWVLVPAIHIPEELISWSRTAMATFNAVPTSVHSFILDQAWYPLEQSDFTIPTERPDILRRMPDLTGSPISLTGSGEAEQLYFGRIEMVPEFAPNSWSSTDTLDVKYESGKPFLSSIVLASDVRDRVPDQRPLEGVIERGDSVIFPRVTGTFQRGEQIFLYFEVSMLMRNEYGQALCRIDLETVTPSGIDYSRGIVRRTIGRLFQRPSPTGQITISIERETIEDHISQWMELELTEENWTTGIFQFRISAHDLVSGAVIEREQTIVLAENGR